MDPAVVEWLPSLLVLGVAVTAGVFLVWHFSRRVRRGQEAPLVPGPAPEERDLLARRDLLLGQLRELLDTAAKREPEQLARERYALELAAAEVLRDLDRKAAEDHESQAVAEEPAAPAEPTPTGNPALRGFLWATGSMLLVGGLIYLVSQQATSRQEGTPVTGNVPGMASSPEDPDAAGAQAAVAKNPNDLEARMDLARVHLGRQDMMGVWNETQFILSRNPQHPQALSYQALVRLAMGQSDLALEMLKQALQTTPDFLDGYVHLALVYVRTGKTNEADAAIAEATRRFPAQKEMLQRVLAEMKAQTPIESASANSDEPNPHTAIPAPGVPAPDGRPAPDAAPVAPPASGLTISGFIELDPALLGQVTAGATIWVMARPAGAPSEAPLAVARLAAGPFPLAFELSSAQSMGGGALPETVLVEARLDDDGDAATRTPNDPRAKLDGVKLGTRGVKLVLKRGQ